MSFVIPILQDVQSLCNSDDAVHGVQEMLPIAGKNLKLELLEITGGDGPVYVVLSLDGRVEASEVSEASNVCDVLVLQSRRGRCILFVRLLWSLVGHMSPQTPLYSYGSWIIRSDEIRRGMGLRQSKGRRDEPVGVDCGGTSLDWRLYVAGR
jgi:hypothetical protein